MLEIKEGASLQWQAPSFEGPIPAVRESHTAITWGTKLVVYGGMNGKRLGDLWILDTDPWKWTNVGCQGKVPLPRSLHVSSIIKNRLATLSLFLLLSILFLFSRSLSLSLVSFLFYPLSLSLSLLPYRMYTVGGWVPVTGDDGEQPVHEAEWKCTNSLACFNLGM